MKKLFFIGLTLLILVGCSSKKEPIVADFKVAEFEAKLNEGENLDGKTVEITVDNFEPASAFGYNIMTGEHLNFVSSKNPNVKVGDSLIVEVTEVQSMLGSFIIKYEVKE